MLYDNDSITVVVTALNVLGAQTADDLEKAGISAINVTGANAMDATFKVIIILLVITQRLK